MSRIIFAASLMLSLVVFSSETTSNAWNVSTNTHRNVREAMRRIDMRKHGGTVRQANSAKGVFVVLNCQKRVAAEEIDKALSVIDQRIRAQVKRVEVDRVTIENILTIIKESGGTTGVAVVDASQSFPALLSATEEGWAMVNVGKLAIDAPKADVLNARVRREVLRGFSFAVGGVYGARGDSLMLPVREPKDLDRLSREDFAITMMQTFSLVMPYYGMRPWHERKYDKACQEGWAPPPTNEFQKAIWDKTHAIPKTPMKIEFDPKKGR
ncbi:MAG: hypothetical protein IJG84_19485 [Kiritimatiellae bacterium]|nr:hypothetical protein [Kiritimatiellia bacterium]